MADHDFDYINKTAYSIESVAIRSTWAGYCLFVIASSFIGDTIILIASTKFRVFKLHDAIVAIIQHIAFCDLMVSAIDILPRFVYIVSNDWVLGNFICILAAYSRYYLNAVSVLLLCTLTSCKFYLLKYPLHLEALPPKKAHVICTACWLAALAFPITFLVDKADIYPSYKDYQCSYAATSEIWQWMKLFLAVAFIFVPTCLVVASTIFILVIAKRFARRGCHSLKLQGTMAIVLTATVYCASFLPYVIFRVVESILSDSDRDREDFLIKFYRVVLAFISLNTISNFFIYSLTVVSFRRFVFKLLIPHQYQNLYSE